MNMVNTIRCKSTNYKTRILFTGYFTKKFLYCYY